MKSLLKTAALLLALATAALATPGLATPGLARDGVHITDPYARVLVGNGAVYFTIHNHAATDDVLLSASSPVAAMVHLMNSAADANGMMKMGMVRDGFAVAAGQSRTLGGGGDHVMLMQVTQKLVNGDTFPLVLTFAKAGEVTLTVPVDNTRTTDPGPGPTPFDASAATGENATDHVTDHAIHN